MCSRIRYYIPIIVFIPFMLMSIIIAILLFVFGLDPYSGKLHYKDLLHNN